MIHSLLTTLALALYIVAAVRYGAILFLHAPAAPTASPGSALAASLSSPSNAMQSGRLPLLAGILLQFAAIGALCSGTHHSPFASVYGTLSVLAWAIALSFAALDLRLHLPAVGAIALPVACTVLFWGVLNGHAPIADTPLLTGRIVSLHVLAILASFGLFALAFGCAMLYVLQSRLLKQHRVSGLFERLPPLATLDRVAFQAVAYALPLLTLGLALGITGTFGKGITQPPAAWLRDPHTIVSFVTWALYVFYLAARLAAGWRGVRLQYILLMGWLVALAVYILPTSTHRFG